MERRGRRANGKHGSSLTHHDVLEEVEVPAELVGVDEAGAQLVVLRLGDKKRTGTLQERVRLVHRESPHDP